MDTYTIKNPIHCIINVIKFNKIKKINGLISSMYIAIDNKILTCKVSVIYNMKNIVNITQTYMSHVSLEHVAIGGNTINSVITQTGPLFSNKIELKNILHPITILGSNKMNLTLSHKYFNLKSNLVPKFSYHVLLTESNGLNLVRWTNNELNYMLGKKKSKPPLGITFVDPINCNVSLKNIRENKYLSVPSLINGIFVDFDWHSGKFDITCNISTISIDYSSYSININKVAIESNKNIEMCPKTIVPFTDNICGKKYTVVPIINKLKVGTDYVSLKAYAFKVIN